LEIRYHWDDDFDRPHIAAHGVIEEEVEQVLARPIERRRGAGDSVVLIGKTSHGRVLRVIAAFDTDGEGCFVITAYELRGKPLKALRRRMKRRGQ
jgi:hypothetical protein